MHELLQTKGKNVGLPSLHIQPEARDTQKKTMISSLGNDVQADSIRQTP